MKRLIIATLVCLLGTTAISAQGYYTKKYNDQTLVKKAKKWAKKGEWRNGFQKASPHKTVNLTDFYVQYNKNPELWKALFQWLEQTDLLAIPAGKTPIPGTPLIASVEDSENGPLEKRNTESHYKNIDFMYVVRGTEGFCRLDHLTSTPNTKYKPDVIRYKYLPEKLEYFESVPGQFNIMFPDDWHIAKVQTKKSDQTLRVIVVKMPVGE